MKLLAFAASNSQRSINRSLVAYSLDQLNNIIPDLETDLVDLNAFEMPIYSIDRENDTGIPGRAHDFFSRIGGADAVLVSYAEHNGSVTSAWKNIFDWMSRIDMKVWQEKPVVMLAATPGSRAGANVLNGQAMLAPHFGATVLGHYGVGNWGDAWDQNQQSLLQDSDRNEIDKLLSNLAQQA